MVQEPSRRDQGVGDTEGTRPKADNPDGRKGSNVTFEKVSTIRLEAKAPSWSTLKGGGKELTPKRPSFVEPIYATVMPITLFPYPYFTLCRGILRLSLAICVIIVMLTTSFCYIGEARTKFAKEFQVLSRWD